MCEKCNDLSDLEELLRSVLLEVTAGRDRQVVLRGKDKRL